MHRAYNLHKRSSQEYVSQTISKKLTTIFSQKLPVKEAGGNDVKKVIQKVRSPRLATGCFKESKLNRKPQKTTEIKERETKTFRAKNIRNPTKQADKVQKDSLQKSQQLFSYHVSSFFPLPNQKDAEASYPNRAYRPV